MPTTEVHILGQKYTIKGDAPEEHIRELARFIDGHIKEVCDKFPTITPTKAIVLAMFNIAEELYSQRAEQEDIARSIEKKADLLAGLFEGGSKKSLF